MKNLHLFMTLMLAAVIGFSSCSKKDDDKKPAIEVTGTWGITSFTYEGYWEMGGDYTPVVGEGSGLSAVRLTFNSDGTVSGNGKSFTFFIMSKEDNTDKIKLTPKILEGGGAWQKDGNTLYISDFFGESVDQLTIVELTATTMHLTASFETETGSGKMSSIDMKLVRKD